MPGLGGVAHSRTHVLETADALSQSDPDFIRIRTLAVTDFSDLAREVRAGNFTKPNDVETARELLLFLENRNGITSKVKSDHILNLFQEVDGVLPQDRSAMTAPIQRFLTLSPEKQMLYRVGRRTGIFSKLADMDEPQLAAHAERILADHGVTLDRLDEFTDDMIQQFI